jgi:N-acetylglutamate synthase-like GNAT family acetyltransferase
MSELTIREMEQDEDFAAWYSEILEQEEDASGVAHLVNVVVLPQERHQGHAHRLLAAFEHRAAESGAHMAEFWTDDERSEGLLAALGWRRIFHRENYVGRRSWSLMEKQLSNDSR